MLKKIDKKKSELDFLDRRKERLVQKLGTEEFNNTVGEIIKVLKKNNLDKSPTAREDLFEYVEGLINL